MYKFESFCIVLTSSLKKNKKIFLPLVGMESGTFCIIPLIFLTEQTWHLLVCLRLLDPYEVIQGPKVNLCPNESEVKDASMNTSQVKSRRSEGKTQ